MIHFTINFDGASRALIGLLMTFPVIGLCDAKSDYENYCTACHGFGIAGAPKLGDKENWAPRLTKDKETLYQNAINGFTGAVGVMPPKGGFSQLSDESVRAIVDYMTKTSQ